MESQPAVLEGPSRERTTLAVLFFPDLHAQPTAGALAKLRRVERYKRNARSPEYMRELARVALGSRCGLVELPVVGNPAQVATEQLETAEEVVLLWPDAIGHGWWPIERRVLAAKGPATHVSVLNGRGRRFSATPTSLLAFRMRRAVERLWLGEIAMAAGLFLAAPFLVTWDKIRGRG